MSLFYRGCQKVTNGARKLNNARTRWARRRGSGVSDCDRWYSVEKERAFREKRKGENAEKLKGRPA
jgi:hypothetical protein